MKFSLIAIVMLAGCASTPPKILTSPQYQRALSSHIERRLNASKALYPEYNCTFLLTQDETGAITDVRMGKCDASDSLKSVFEKTIGSSSPLPLPDDSSLFDREIAYRFCRGCEPLN